ncbi:isoleucine--tRNA ligase [Elusimicrobiota bacterium]
MNYNKTLNLPKTVFSMKADLSRREPEIQKIWEEMDLYGKLLEKNRDSKSFILHDGPPYANGHIHLGHALNRILKDIVLKYKAMTGHFTPFVPGWDCHGLPVEYELLKKLGTRQIKDKLDFRKKAAQYARNFVNIQKNEFKRLGLLGDWDNPYLTLLPEYEEKIIDVFKELYLKNYIVKKLKPVYWCYSCKTALAEAEVEYQDIGSPSVFVKFELIEPRPDFVSDDEKVFALVWTTTPWTLPSNVALCFNPDFNYSYIKKESEYLIVAEEFVESYKEYVKVATAKGKNFEAYKFKPPFGSRLSSGILGDFVTLDEGTGIVHIAPGHGEEDYLIGKKYDLPILSPVDENGRFTKDAGIERVEGKTVFESDPIILDILQQEGILKEKGELFHSYPHCWRCKKPIIFRATEQWFLLIDEHDLRNKVIERIDDVKWYPEISRKRITAMIESRPDWCLSRQRLWGVPIPVFYCSKCREVFANEETFERIKQFVKKYGSDGWFEFSARDILGGDFSCECGSNNFEKEEDILDVWFDSGVSSFAVLETRAQHTWPADMYLEGSDQHRGWFQTSIIPSVAVRNRPPYKSVFTHGFTVDNEGKKMSKSLGNVTSPQEIVEKYGADLLRLWVSSENYYKDVKISKEILEQSVVYYRRIRNTIRFILGNIRDLKEEDKIEYANMTDIDKFVLSRFSQMVKEVILNYEEFLFFRSIRLMHDFCNNMLSSFYFNIVKDRLYVLPHDSHKRRSTQTVIMIMGEMFLKLIAPILSHTAEESWQTLKNEMGLSGDDYPESIFLCDMPGAPEDWNNEQVDKKWDHIVELRSSVLKEIEISKAAGKLKDPLESSVKILVSSKELYAILKEVESELNEYFVVSSVTVDHDDSIVSRDEIIQPGYKITVERASGKKCVRCWLIKDDYAQVSDHPDLCKRCTDIVQRA